MKLFNFTWRFGLAAFMFWCAGLALNGEDIAWATVYLALGALNTVFAVDDIR